MPEASNPIQSSQESTHTTAPSGTLEKLFGTRNWLWLASCAGLFTVATSAAFLQALRDDGIRLRQNPL